jgi:hypothetical protein
LGRLNVAKVNVSNVTGAVMAAKKGNWINEAQTRCILVKAQAKKIKDSYKLLKGK